LIFFEAKKGLVVIGTFFFNGALISETLTAYTDKKENQIFLIFKEIRNGAIAKSYMTNGLLLYGEIFAHFLIY
jgi:hypothetical protein